VETITLATYSTTSIIPVKIPGTIDILQPILVVIDLAIIVIIIIMKNLETNLRIIKS